MNLKLVLIFAAVLRCAYPATYDLIIRNGTVVDGTGAPAVRADVAVKAGRIAAVGKLNDKAATVINASGLVVAPGFIDVHTHADNAERQPLAENFVRMGVTTLVTGNCGGSVRDVAEYFRRLEATNIAVNVATLIGHGTVRSRAMGGSFNRAPTEAELAKMKAHVEQAMRDGALGLSTGLIYLPGVFASTDEIIELAKIAAAYGGIYATHMRNEGDKIFEALEETFAIARAARIPVQISHIKISGKSRWGQAAAVLAAIDRARAGGLQIAQDQYVYTASSTGLSRLIPESAREGGKFRERIADPKQKAKIAAQMKKNLQHGRREDYSFVVIASCKHDPSLNGLNIPQAAKKLLGSASLDEQIELILELERKGGATCIYHAMVEEDVQVFLRDPNTMVASDGGLRTPGNELTHPRSYGNTARVLARYVRELRLLSLEEAIRKMTSLPATAFGLTDRGLIRPGAWADLVVFDPAKVQDHATFQNPHRYASGFARVFVNGTVVVKDDSHTGARPGRPLRRNMAQ
ncbi:MAG: D-aminoacylase [Verrucomicrobiae bacterium]|nr:D-aminoacylase [Verrucomicrobiae bacterium]